MRKLRGFTLIELLIVVAIIAILAAIAVPNFLEAQVRAKVSRVRSDLRSLATALESYFIDNNAYPVYTTFTAMTVNADLNLGSGGAGDLYPTFRIRVDAADQFMSLTTPQAYITSYFTDPFALTRGITFAYYTDTAGWIVWSMGPDSDQTQDVASDLGPANAYETIYNSAIAQPSPALVAESNTGGDGNAYTYDPTNGTTSEGDVYRVRQ